ncbi:13286_t:CDS:2, partial [Dentiscutata heterogama]
IQEFPLSLGWALKKNIKLGNKGAGKRMTKKVLQYLQGFFLAGNLRAEDHYSPEDMHANLEDLAANGELTFEKIPTEASEKALSESNSYTITSVENVNTKRR